MPVTIHGVSTCTLRRRCLRLAASSLLGVMFLVPLDSAIALGHGRTQERRGQLEDPMFGISYDSSRVHYEVMPAPLRQMCPGYERGIFWVYAHIKRAFGDYYVVMGVTPGQNGDSLGAALLIKDGQCRVEDSTRMLSGFVPDRGYRPEANSGTLPGLGAPQLCNQGPFGDCHYVLRSADEEDVLRDLVRDALGRGARAWGEATQFKAAVCNPALREAASSMPIVQQELTRFCK